MVNPPLHGDLDSSESSENNLNPISLGDPVDGMIPNGRSTSRYDIGGQHLQLIFGNEIVGNIINEQYLV